MTMYQIVRQWPVYHHSTDGLIGHQSAPLPMTYLTKAYALRRAGELRKRDWSEGGDDDYYVIDATTGERQWRDWTPPLVDDYMPF